MSKTIRNRLPKGHLYKRGITWWVQWKYKSLPYAVSLKTDSKEKAKPLFIAHMNQVNAAIGDGSFFEKFGNGNEPPIQVVSDEIFLKDAWTAYVKSTNRPDTGKHTLEQYQYQFNKFVTWMAEKYPETNTIVSVTKPIARHFSSEVAENNAPSTFNKYMNLLHLVFRTLNDTLDITINPWDGIQRKRADTQGKRNLSKDEQDVIFAKAQGEIYTLFALGCCTGLRMGDCCMFEWSAVDLDKRIIRCKPHKTRKSTDKTVTLYILDRLYEHLKALKENGKEANGKYVCPEMAAFYPTDWGAAVSRKIQRFLSKDCGIKLHSKNSDGRLVVEVGFHSLRHTFVTLAKEAGLPRVVVEAVVGWGNPYMEKVYTHLSDEYLIESMKKMETKKKTPKKANENLKGLSNDALVKAAKSIQKELARRQKAS